MIQDYLLHILRQAIGDLQSSGKISFQEIPPLALEEPPDKTFGDYSSNVALVLARQARMAPRTLAELILQHIQDPEGEIEKIEIGGPGFINFYLSSDWLYRVLRKIDREGEAYGRSSIGQGKRIQVEFVSANPTGPIVVVQGRAGAMGDTLANLLSAIGYDVQREYYINDAGNQVYLLGKSVEARYLQLLGQDATLPEDGYHGEYVIEIARHILETEGDRYLNLPSEERALCFRDLSVQYILENQRHTMERFGIHFDCWFSERTLHESGKVEEVIRRLQELGYTYESEGALWFKSTAFGEEKDEVLVRSNGAPTYLAGDIAYHVNKFERGFDHVIDIWGPDHHGHVSRLQTAIRALGYPGRLEILLHQWVRLLSGGELVSSSKRAGQVVLLDELLDEVGRDAARFFFLMRSADTPLDFDLELAKKQASENPVYYVQYAHARICSILRESTKREGKEELAIPSAEEANLSLLTHPAERDLLRKMADFPDEVLKAAQTREPHRLTRYAQDLASAFHLFYRDCRVLTDDPELRKARLVLVNGARIVLKNTLQLLGVSAPEKM
jgi:arginyl-tRNA synthetase